MGLSFTATHAECAYLSRVHSGNSGKFTPQENNPLYTVVQKGGQVTKPIMVVKIPCELLCVIKLKGFFHKQSAKLLGLT